MPAPMKAFEEAAIEIGGIEGHDYESLKHFYRDILPNLPKEKVLQIYRYIFAFEGRDDLDP